MEKDSFAKLSHNLLIPLLGKIAQISKYAADDAINIFIVSVNLQNSTHLEVHKTAPPSARITDSILYFAISLSRRNLFAQKPA